jgi:hypothetical protein
MIPETSSPSITYMEFVRQGRTWSRSYKSPSSPPPPSPPTRFRILVFFVGESLSWQSMIPETSSPSITYMEFVWKFAIQNKIWLIFFLPRLALDPPLSQQGIFPGLQEKLRNCNATCLSVKSKRIDKAYYKKMLLLSLYSLCTLLSTRHLHSATGSFICVEFTVSQDAQGYRKIATFSTRTNPTGNQNMSA